MTCDKAKRNYEAATWLLNLCKRGVGHIQRKLFLWVAGDFDYAALEHAKCCPDCVEWMRKEK